MYYTIFVDVILLFTELLKISPLRHRRMCGFTLFPYFGKGGGGRVGTHMYFNVHDVKHFNNFTIFFYSFS